MGTTAGPTTVTAATGDLLFANGLFLGTGARDAGPNGVYVTTNGTAWCCNFAGTSIGGSYGAGLAYGQGTYLWVLQNIPQFTSWPYLYTSGNGTTWVTRFLPMTVFPGNPNYAYYESMKGKALGAAFGNGTFVVVGEAGYIIQSGNIGGTPLILQEPADRGAVAGNPASFSINVSGAQPLAYQWFHSGAAITDATNATVTIAHVTPGDIGGYQVVVTNSFGSVTSRVAQLTVSFLDIKMYAGIEILGIAGRTYRIEGTAATGPVNWQTLTNLILPSSPYTWIDPGSPAAGARLYRAAELP